MEIQKQADGKIALDRNMYRIAATKRQTFSQFLENVDPTPEGSALDAFERQLKLRGIVTKSLTHKGIVADIVEDAFYRTDDNDILFPEYVARQVREAIVEDTILPYLIGATTFINANSYKTVYADDQPKQQKKRRVTEAAELPRAVLKIRDQEVKIWKFGRAIESSYEAIRRMQIDMLALHLRRIAMQVAKDKVAEILAVIKDGDGNSNAAPVIRMKADLDSGATEKTISPKAFLEFLMLFEEFPADTFIAGKKAFIEMVMTQFPTLSTTEVIAMLMQGASTGVRVSAPQMPNKSVNVIWNKDISDWHIHGINRKYAIEQVTEVGSDITEADKFITRQTSVLTISENSGYSKIFKEATKTLNIDA